MAKIVYFDKGGIQLRSSDDCYDASRERHLPNFDGQGNTLVWGWYPCDYPDFVVMTMTDSEAKEARDRLLTEGWEKY